MKKNPPKRRRRSGEPPAAAAPDSPSLVVFDSAIVADLCDMLPAADFAGLLRRAIEALPATLDDLRQTWDGQDWTETRRHAHKLAGLAGNFGCVAMMEAARQIEAACAGRKTRQIRRLLGDLDRLLPPTLEALRQGPARPAPAAG